MLTTLIEIAVSIVPVFIFLGMLVIFDSFKLVKWQDILITIFIGCLAALVSLGINLIILAKSGVEQIAYVRYIAPIVEESTKALYIFYLLRRRKIGFMIDAAIYGFAVGAGFGLRIDIEYFVIRLDVGVPLRKPYLVNNSNWIFDNPGFWSDYVISFAIGYPF